MSRVQAFWDSCEPQERMHLAELSNQYSYRDVLSANLRDATRAECLGALCAMSVVVGDVPLVEAFRDALLDESLRNT